MRRKYGNKKINKKMQIFELKTQYQIYMMTRNAQQKSSKVTNDDVFKSIIKKEEGLNPFLQVMNFRISFKTWMKQAKKLVKTQVEALAMITRDDEFEENYVD